MVAASCDGRAINITQTTTAHAFSYKITSLYNLSHGHAVAVCLPEIWDYMIGHMEKCIDNRGKEYLMRIFDSISKAMGCENPKEAISALSDIQIKDYQNISFDTLESLLTSHKS